MSKNPHKSQNHTFTSGFNTHAQTHTHTNRYAMPLLLQPEPLSCLPLLSSPTYSSSPLIHFFHFPILSSHSPLFAPPPLPHIPFFLYIYFGFTLLPFPHSYCCVFSSYMLSRLAAIMGCFIHAGCVCVYMCVYVRVDQIYIRSHQGTTFKEGKR